MRILTAILFLLACATASAQYPHGYIFTVSPNPVPVGTSIGVTIETIGIPCVALWETLGFTVQDDGVVYITVPDSDACDAVAQETRHYTIDALPPGEYRFRFYSCGGLDAETNEPACGTLEEVAVTVLGLGAQRVTIPTLSTTGLLMLVLLVMGVGWRFR